MPLLVFIVETLYASFGLYCEESMYILCVISDFGSGVNEICAFQGFCC